MGGSTRVLGSWRRRLGLVGLVALVAVAAVAGDVAADEGGSAGAGADPSALALSDGRVVPATAAQAVTASRANAGTGVVPARSGARTDLSVTQAEPGQEISPRNTIGTDDRIRVTNTTVYPYRAVGQITGNVPGGSYICTGWLISPNTVATAAHCLHEGRGKGFTSNIRFYPGRNGFNNPFGGCLGRLSMVPVGWVNNGGTLAGKVWDYGAFKLNCNIGNSVGWFGFKATSGTGLVGKQSLNTGYPGDKPSGTHWRSSNTFRVAQERLLFYGNDTAGGLSGSPVYQATGCGGPCGLAVHAYGWGAGQPAPANRWNHGPRITSTVNQFFVAAKNRA